MSRYFLVLSYCGTKFNGWQSQNGQLGSRCVQEVLENSFFTLTRNHHDITGCGRTDTGVHAKRYIAHVDSNSDLSDRRFLVKINTLLPEDIVIHDIYKVKDSAHARFDAVSRSYSYHIHLSKSPFPELSFHYFYKKPQLHILNEAAGVLLKYQDFNTFCKTKTDVTSTICNITKANWIMIDEDHLEFQISADRFLRGMVRLITGMCLDVDRGKLNLDEVRYALENKSRLPRHWSVPALGLFLKDIEYPDTIRENK